MFLIASLSFFFYLVFSSCLVPHKLLYGQYLVLVSSYSIFLDYAIPPYSGSPFYYFFPYSPISYGRQSHLWHGLFFSCYLYCLQMLYQLRFPSHTSVYSSFGSHIHQNTYFNPSLRCESVRIAFILPTSALPFPITFAMCAF